jgi:hypothetical protein
VTERVVDELHLVMFACCLGTWHVPLLKEFVQVARLPDGTRHVQILVGASDFWINKLGGANVGIASLTTVNSHPTGRGLATPPFRFGFANVVPILTGIIRGSGCDGNKKLRGLLDDKFDRLVVHKQVFPHAMTRDEQDMTLKHIESLGLTQFHGGNKGTEPFIIPVNVRSVPGIVLNRHHELSSSLVFSARAGTVGRIARHFGRRVPLHANGQD